MSFTHKMPFEVIERYSRSWPMYIVQCLLKPLPPELLLNSSKWGVGWKDTNGSPKLTIPPFGLSGCTVVPRVVEGFNVYDFIPGPKSGGIQKNSTTQKKRIYFFAGGAFLAPAGIFHTATCAQLASRIPATIVTLISYPLSPLNSGSSAYATIQNVLQILLAEAQEKGEKAIFIGDSAGGNIVLGLPLASLKDDPNALVPAAIMAISPAVDFNHANPLSKTIEPYDCMLSNKFCKESTRAWRGDWSRDDPRLSPIKADLSPYVKHGVQIHGVIGKYDVLAPDAEAFMRKCKAAGISGKWLLWDKQMHDFALSGLVGLPEGISGLNFIVRTLTEV